MQSPQDKVLNIQIENRMLPTDRHQLTRHASKKTRFLASTAAYDINENRSPKGDLQRLVAYEVIGSHGTWFCTQSLPGHFPQVLELLCAKEDESFQWRKDKCNLESWPWSHQNPKILIADCSVEVPANT
ncbi:hypothetical protein AVEN_56400-1 [Araneus ventricosus]|uniref:Uncharacterized protein n=1 Tax=Araneus ventricosus TaxID=182803 RepID=A0A4Y2GLQ0_ARAVE|nr:hypothetical protein AVEN_56400-1 [Araneus ventricosus]